MSTDPKAVTNLYINKYYIVNMTTDYKEAIEESGMEYTPKLKAELDSVYAAYKKGQTKMVSSTESKMLIGEILKTRSEALDNLEEKYDF
jgi:hypothetical protein